MQTFLPGCRWQTVILLLCGAILFFWRLGVPGLMDPDEGRYAEIAREMLASGDFITPQLNFLPYLEKPPLVYWLTALSIWIGGPHEWTARLIPAVSALLGLSAVYWLARRLFGEETARLATVITATSAGYFLLGRILTLDMPLTACLTWAVALAYVAWRQEERRALFWAYLAMGLGVLTKGPVAVVLPALIFLVWMILEKQWRQWRRLWHPGGALLLVLIVVPWYLLAAWQNPEFFRYFFWEEHVQRFVNPRVHAGQPVYFYVGVVLVGMLPWTFLLPWAWGASRDKEADAQAASDRRFLLVWFGVVFVFFSLARAKLFPYLLPGLPPLALLLARALASTAVDEQQQSSIWRWTLRGWLLTAAALLAAGFILFLGAPQTWERLAFLAPYLTAGGILLAALPLLLLLGRFSPAARRGILIGGALILNILLILGLERLAPQRSPRLLAELINQQRQAHSVILGYQSYSQGISFYTGQPVYLFGLRGELDFGLRQRPANPYFFGTIAQVSAFLQRHPDFFVIIDPENLKIFQSMHPYPVKVLAKWRKYLLIRNG